MSREKFGATKNDSEMKLAHVINAYVIIFPCVYTSTEKMVNSVQYIAKGGNF